MVESFIQRKKAVLEKNDKSNKGNWDEKILKLCEKINFKENIYTTSSCSGRIAIMLDKEKKAKGLFIKIYHDKISLEELKKDLQKIKSFDAIKFKQEPCILHVVCKNLDEAEDFLEKAFSAGWKKSGIISLKKNRITVEINGTGRLEFPLMNKKNLLVDENFLKLIIKKSNENLEKSWKKINLLEKFL